MAYSSNSILRSVGMSCGRLEQFDFETLISLVTDSGHSILRSVGMSCGRLEQFDLEICWDILWQTRAIRS